MVGSAPEVVGHLGTCHECLKSSSGGPGLRGGKRESCSVSSVGCGCTVATREPKNLCPERNES